MKLDPDARAEAIASNTKVLMSCGFEPGQAEVMARALQDVAEDLVGIVLRVAHNKIREDALREAVAACRKVKDDGLMLGVHANAMRAAVEDAAFAIEALIHPSKPAILTTPKGVVSETP